MKYDFTHRYTSGVSGKRIALLGIVPPPLGGVSVHIQRVMHKLRMQNNRVFFFRTEPRLRNILFPFYLMHLFFWLLIKRPQVVYYHSVYLRNSDCELITILFARCFVRFALSLIEHDSRHMYKRTVIFKKIYQWVLSKTTNLILIGDKTFESYKATVSLTCDYSLEGAFLPPDTGHEPMIVGTYPKELFAFMSHHSPLVMVNGFQLTLLDKIDLYGIDQCITLINALKKEFSDVGLIIALAQRGNSTYYKQLKKMIADLDLENNIFFLEGQKELWPLFKRIDCFIRPSISDGASVSVQEALFFNTPVVASDVCERPQGTYIFKSQDTEDLAIKLTYVLNKRLIFMESDIKSLSINK